MSLVTPISLPTRFHRLFSCNFRKNLTLPLASMPLSEDFVNATRGDPCPLLDSKGSHRETVSAGTYRVQTEQGLVTRLIGTYAPYATYDAIVQALNGAVGFTFIRDQEQMHVLFASGNDGRISLIFENGTQTEVIETEFCFIPGMRVLVTSRNAFLDCYIDSGNGYAASVHTFEAKGWENLNDQKIIKTVKAGFTVRGCAEVSSVRCYMDCGLKQADIRPIRYEDGRVLMEGGKVYLTMSIRMEASCYSGVFSWVPGTEQFALVGTLFFDRGDGILGNDVASSIIYHRPSGMWYLWICSFTHGHILAHAEMDADPRFGVNVIDYQLMELMHEDDDDTVFRGKPADEDPDFLYDKKTGKWYMTICRIAKTEEGNKYRYHLFESDHPFDGYRFVTRSSNGDETGGSLLLRDDGLYFVCGSSFSKRARYHIYHLPDMENPTVPTFDYDDGGFRGWGTYIPVKRGTRETIYHLTFDRERGSDFNWSYGNLYCFIPD